MHAGLGTLPLQASAECAPLGIMRNNQHSGPPQRLLGSSWNCRLRTALLNEDAGSEFRLFGRLLGQGPFVILPARFPQ
jgi:hypothetical protein